MKVTTRVPSCAQKGVATVVCVAGTLGIAYVLFKDLVQGKSKEDTKEESRNQGFFDWWSLPKSNCEGICLQPDDLLKGPEVYQDMVEGTLAEVIRTRFLLPPSDKPYNLTKGLNPNYHDGQIGQPRVIDKILKGQTNGFFVECGAFDGELFSNSLFFELKRNWTGLLVEPNSKTFAALVAKNRKSYAINSCLSMHNYAEEADFLNSWAVGSLQEVPANPLSTRLRRGRNTFSSKVQCFPLFNLLLSLGIPTVDLFSLDVEGSEMGVLQTIPWHRVNIRVILLEVVLGNIATFNAFLGSKGYDLHLDMKKGKADAIYVKRDQKASMDLP